jgi:hypothetical protein|tara:strand:- start:4633 stop:5088 length:456 start_codon:yes stop_codon:yes gene_type:complete
MTDEFYYVIKLVTGEEIFAIASLDVDKDGNNIVILCNPVTMKIIKRGLVSGIKVEPWMKIPDEDVFTINMDKVITISQVSNKEVIKFYKKYLDETLDDDLDDEYDDSAKLVKPDQKMGYLGTVTEARVKLEEIFKLDVSDNHHKGDSTQEK